MINTANNTKRKEQKVEEMGIFFEKSGLAPMHGRVFAYLLLAEPPHKDFYEIQEFLKASKSAISNALKFLMEKNMVKYLTFSGDRRRYFQVDTYGWLKHNKMQILQATAIKKWIQEILELRADSKHLDFNENLEMIVAFYAELSDVLDEFVQKWSEKMKS